METPVKHLILAGVADFHTKCFGAELRLALILIGMGFASVVAAACPDENSLMNQYRRLSLEIAQLGFRITELGLPVTDPKVIQLELKVVEKKKERDIVQARLSDCRVQ